MSSPELLTSIAICFFIIDPKKFFILMKFRNDLHYLTFTQKYSSSLVKKTCHCPLILKAFRQLGVFSLDISSTGKYWYNKILSPFRACVFLSRRCIIILIKSDNRLFVLLHDSGVIDIIRRRHPMFFGRRGYGVEVKSIISIHISIILLTPPA